MARTFPRNLLAEDLKSDQGSKAVGRRRWA